MSNHRPLVSLVMAAYNSAPYIEQALNSLAVKTICDIDIIVVDDGSTDATAEIVGKFLRQDSRFRLIRLERNQGQATALNSGIAQARGKYLAIMDADDVAVPERVALQINAFVANPALIPVGGAIRTWCDRTGELGQSWLYEREDQRIRALSIFKSEFAHGVMMFDLEKFRCHKLQFDKRWRYGSDWMISLDAMRHGEVSNLSDTLIHYRIHGSQVTASMGDTLDSDSTHIRRRELAWLGVDFTDAELRTHLAVSPCNYWAYGHHPYFVENRITIAEQSDAWFRKLSIANSISLRIDQQVLEDLLLDLRERVQACVEQSEPKNTKGFYCPVLAQSPCLAKAPCR